MKTVFHVPELHPFAKYVAILARGKTRSRALTQEEAADAMQMILSDQARPEQIGAFLMLLRLREETSEETAGFAQGSRATIDVPENAPDVDVDWSSYAGKRIQLPWFILSALALASAGYKVFMHGTDGHTPGRVYTRSTLETLGVPVSKNLEDAALHLGQNNFAYAPIEAFCPKLQELIQLRPIFGLRSPVHSFSRMLNPFSAPVMMQGIFHRGFMDIHAGAAILLNQPHSAVFRGDGGEIERRPNKPTVVWETKGQEEPVVSEWPAILSEPHQPADQEMDVGRLVDVWAGDRADEYGEAAVVGTLAITLKTMQKAATPEDAQVLAQQIWNDRNKSRLLTAA